MSAPSLHRESTDSLICVFPAILFTIICTFTTEGEDFQFPSDPPVINILSGMDRGCLTIEIIDSAVLKGEERINLEINKTTMAIVEDRQTTVVIEGDGSA